MLIFKIRMEEETQIIVVFCRVEEMEIKEEERKRRGNKRIGDE